MKLAVFICMMSMLLAVWAASTVNLDCTKICADPKRHDESEAAHCGCPHSHSHHVTEKPIEQLSHTTLSLCDYLCSIQMGGSACDCSVSIVPGKRIVKLFWNTHAERLSLFLYNILTICFLNYWLFPALSPYDWSNGAKQYCSFCEISYAQNHWITNCTCSWAVLFYPIFVVWTLAVFSLKIPLTRVILIDWSISMTLLWPGADSVRSWLNYLLTTIIEFKEVT